MAPYRDRNFVSHAAACKKGIFSRSQEATKKNPVFADNFCFFLVSSRKIAQNIFSYVHILVLSLPPNAFGQKHVLFILCFSLLFFVGKKWVCEREAPKKAFLRHG
eukprot:GEMP01135744.1.p1 GENE.GEMP01135744.1~~GEMP01135744.1.p1  ORF type:complete len:105 (+),score=4.71 GEMP01135744.1:64-378(+)